MKDGGMNYILLTTESDSIPANNRGETMMDDVE